MLTENETFSGTEMVVEDSGKAPVRRPEGSQDDPLVKGESDSLLFARLLRAKKDEVKETSNSRCRKGIALWDKPRSF